MMLRAHPVLALAFAALFGASACGDSDATGSGAAGGADTSTGGQGGASISLPDPTQFVATGSLTTGRTNHSATLLADGRVAIIGGEDYDYAPLRSIEVFDRASGNFTVGSDLLEARTNHTATRLDSGLVLIVGGGRTNNVGAPAGQDVLGSSELFDPEAGTVATAPSLGAGRSHHTATLLADGRMLVVGGASDSHVVSPSFGDALGSVEIFDPIEGSWRDLPALATPRFLHSATLLGDGRVLIAGGSNASEDTIVASEIFDPQSETWATGPSLKEARVFHASAGLPDGGALVVGGKLANIKFLATSERLDATASTFADAAALPESRTGLGLSALSSGRLLATAGLHGSNAGFKRLDDAHIFDPELGSWTAIGKLGGARVLHSQTVLQTGEVLIVGGLGANSVLSSAELAVP